MAIEDVSFYNLLGEEISREYLLNQMIGFYKLLLGAGETQVTDFNIGSEIRNLLEDITIPVYIMMEEENNLTAIAFLETAYGIWLDMHGSNPFIRLPRDTGLESTGYVTFTIPEALGTDTIIPADTIVSNSSNGLEYNVLNDTILPAGETSVTASIECLTVGADGNCDIGDIDTVSDIDTEIVGLTVTNENKITGGSDYEEDEEYRSRLLEYVRQDDFGSLPYYQRLCNLDSVHDVLLVDDPNETYSKIILVNGYSKPTPANVLAEVLELYTNLNNLVIDHTFNVDTPDYVTIPLTVDLVVSEEIDENLVRTLLNDIFNGGDNMPVAGFGYDGLYIGDNVRGDMLTSNLALLDGVISVHVKVTGESTDLDEYIIDTEELAILGTVTINQTIGE